MRKLNESSVSRHAFPMLIMHPEWLGEARIRRPLCPRYAGKSVRFTHLPGFTTV